MEEIPDDWIFNISDEQMKDIAVKLAALALRIPSITDRARDVIWLICMEDKRNNG